MWDINKIKEYIGTQDWYQKIELTNGLVTPGKVDCKKRLKFLQKENFSNKTVLDMGCNSGFYCLWAKQKGAGKVVGIDIDKMRIQQAEFLAKIEKLDIEYSTKNIFELKESGVFDFVFCFAVLTEIQDFLGAVKILKKVIGYKSFIELAIARPIVYMSTSKYWLKGLFMKKYSTGIFELRPSKAGWMLCPSLKTLRDSFGKDFKVSYLGKGLRYDMVSIERKK